MTFRPAFRESARPRPHGPPAVALLAAVERAGEALGAAPRWVTRGADDLPEPAPVFLSDFEAYVREVARLEGLDPEEMVRDTRDMLDRHGALMEQMIADGSVR